MDLQRRQPDLDVASAARTFLPPSTDEPPSAREKVEPPTSRSPELTAALSAAWDDLPGVSMDEFDADDIDVADVCGPEPRATVGERLRSALPKEWQGAAVGVSSPALVGMLILGVIAVVVVVVLVWQARSQTVEVGLPAAPSPVGGQAAGVSGGPPSPVGVVATQAGAVPGSPSATSPVPSHVVVHVSGQVATPGVVTVTSSARVADAVAAAGGLRPKADTSRVNLAEVVADGAHVHVAAEGEPAQAVSPITQPGRSSTAAGEVKAGVVNINTASASELESLPGVGPVLAVRIVDHRATHGPFPTKDALRDVSGIGEKSYARLAPHITT